MTAVLPAPVGATIRSGQRPSSSSAASSRRCHANGSLAVVDAAKNVAEVRRRRASSARPRPVPRSPTDAPGGRAASAGRRRGGGSGRSRRSSGRRRGVPSRRAARYGWTAVSGVTWWTYRRLSPPLSLCASSTTAPAPATPATRATRTSRRAGRAGRTGRAGRGRPTGARRPRSSTNGRGPVATPGSPAVPVTQTRTWPSGTGAQNASPATHARRSWCRRIGRRAPSRTSSRPRTARSRIARSAGSASAGTRSAKAPAVPDRRRSREPTTGRTGSRAGSPDGRPRARTGR